jgi:hypothetical protein
MPREQLMKIDKNLTYGLMNPRGLLMYELVLRCVAG